MFKVECPGCKAPYQVDERRVPPSGLKMRCPKCGTSFQVEPPQDASNTSPSPVLEGTGGAGAAGGKPPLPKRKGPAKGTMIGVAPPLARDKKAKPPLPRPKATLPRPAAAAAPPAEPGLEEPDLPMAKPSDPDPFGDLDLPDLPARVEPRNAESGDSDLPSPVTRRESDPFALAEHDGTDDSDLPTAARFGATGEAFEDFGDLDLPSPTAAPGGKTLEGHADLPAIPPQDESMALDLPSPGGAPASSPGPDFGEFGEVELPSPTWDAPDFPSPRDSAELPSPAAGLDLPSPVGEMDLPSTQAELPSAQAELPSAQAGLPSAQAELPSAAADLPSGGFGELDLPLAGAEPPAPVGSGDPFAEDAEGFVPAEAEPLGGAGYGAEGGDSLEADPFGAGAETAAGGDPFGAAPQPQAPADPFGAAPQGEASADPFGADSADPFASAPAGGPDADPFGGPPGAPDPFAAPPDDQTAGSQQWASEAGSERDTGEIVRQVDGGTGYGEVNLEGADDGVPVGIEGGDFAEAPDSMEFGEIPQEGEAPRAPAVGAMHVQLAQAGGEAVAEIQAKKRRGRLRVLVGALIVIVLAGGSLALVPSIGPFGAYFVVDQLKRGDYEQLLSRTVDQTREKLSEDTYPQAKEALALAENASQQATRFKPLKAYAAFVGFARILRFGPEPEVHAKAQVLLDELKDETAEVDKLELARATQAAADGKLARARQALEQLGRRQPKSIDVLIVRGEVELRARDRKAALAAWEAAASVEKSARTLFGLARAKMASGDLEAAEKLGQDALERNPRHVGTKILLAQITWHTSQSEAQARKLLERVVANPPLASPEELVQAQTLLGEIHLSRGRISQAEDAFGRALKINPKAARALSGFGDALFKAGRFSQALARFKASAQADPDDINAKVGVAKASIELERLEEAKAMLSKLRESHGKNMDVAYWYGRVQEALGERTEAEKAFRDAIEAGENNAESVHAYVALASLQSQEGDLEKATATLAEAQKRLPESPAIHKAIGRVAMSQGRYEAALEEFENALEIDKDDLDAKFLVGTALSRLRRFDEALEIFEQVASIDRDFPGLALERGLLFQESGRGDQALKEYESALAKAPNDPDLMLRVGCGKATAGDGSEAEKLLRKVLAKRPNASEAHHCLGRALMTKNNLSDALQALKRAVQLDPNKAQYHLYVGWASNEAGDFEEAARALKKALELDQGLADAYWQRGVLRLRQTRAKDAIKDLTKALELRPSRFEAHASLAQAHYDLGMEQKAMAEYERALRANPEQADWQFRYGKLLNLNLRHGDAVRHLRKAVELAKASEQKPTWLSEAHRLLAHSLRGDPEAVEHWQAFLRAAPTDSPYRGEAKAALRRFGKAWEE